MLSERCPKDGSLDMQQALTDKFLVALKENRDETLERLRKKLRREEKWGPRPFIPDGYIGGGFGVRVTEAGTVSFVLVARYPDSKHPVPRAIGEFPMMTLAEAREKAREWRKDIKAGIDPKVKAAREREAAEAAEATRAANSFEAVAEDFIKRHVLATDKGRPKLKSGPEVAAPIRREIVSKWRGRPIVDIARRDVVKLLEDVVDDGRASVAHHLLAYLSKLFNWAIARDVYGLQSSPITRGIGKDIVGAKKPRQRIMNNAEIVEVWQASAALPAPFGALVRMLLITGQRLREVANAKWSEFDLDPKLWTIPPARMKGDAAHEVPLSPFAIEIIGSLAKPEDRKAGASVFSTTASKAPISGFSKAKIALDRLINETRLKADPDAKPIEPFVFHDLRRTVRTALSGLPVPDPVAELVIAHAKPGLHKVYDQHAYLDEKRRALDLWASKLRSIVEPEPAPQGREAANVIPLPVRG
jgi:integrase